MLPALADARSLSHVVPLLTALAQRGEVAVVVLGGVVVDVGASEAGAAAGFGVWSVVLGSVPFAAVLRTVKKDVAGDFIPVFGADGLDVGTDGHWRAPGGAVVFLLSSLYPSTAKLLTRPTTIAYTNTPHPLHWVSPLS